MNAYDEMRAKFEEAGIGTPPVPDPLKNQVRLIRPWTYATFDIESGRLYAFPEGVRAVVEDLEQDSFAVGHEGHGVNSYAIGYQLVFGPLVIVAQVLWGGVYVNEERASAAVRASFGNISSLLELSPPADAPAGHLLVLSSDFRRTRAAGWIGPHEPSDGGAWSKEHAETEPFEAARAFAVANGWTAAARDSRPASRFVWQKGDVRITRKADRDQRPDPGPTSAS